MLEEAIDIMAHVEPCGCPHALVKNALKENAPFSLEDALDEKNPEESAPFSIEDALVEKDAPFLLEDALVEKDAPFSLEDALVEKDAPFSIETSAPTKGGRGGGARRREAGGDAARALAGLTTTTSECAEDAEGRHGEGGPCASRPVVKAVVAFAESKGGEAVEAPLLPNAPTPEAEAVRRAAGALGCESESCVLAHPELQKFAAQTRVIAPAELRRELERSFKAAGPRDSLALLSNFNIDETLQRWARIYPRFFPCPFAMIDFDRNGDLFGTVDLPAVLAGRVAADLGPAHGKVRRPCDTFGCVVNTDPSHLGGHHWFAMFVDCRAEPWTVEYFNSVGSPPPKPIVGWQERTRAALAALGKQVKAVVATDLDHQDSQTECGLYSLYYIRRRLEGVPHTFFATERIPDAAMTEFRKHIFRQA